MKKNRVLFVCKNISEFKEKILPCFMFIKNKGYDIDLVSEDNIDLAFVSKKYIFQSTHKNILLQNLKNINTLKNIINECSYDVIQTLDNCSSILVYKTLKKVKNNLIQTLFYVDDFKKNKSVLKNVVKNSDIVYTNNEEDYEYLLSKKYNKNVKLIHDLAIDFRRYNNLNFDEARRISKEKYMLDENKKYVTIIDIYKDYNYIIKVIKEISIQNSNICFIIKNPNKIFYDKLSKNNCLSHVKIINDAKLLEVLFASDTVLFANVKCYDLGVFVYSLMLGIPVIVPKEEILNLYIEELINGFYCFNKNVQQTILAIGRSVNIPKVKLEGLMKFNYKYINKFSSDKYTHLMSNMYEEINIESKKDIYIIENLRKKESAEILMSDIQRNAPEDATVITIDTSKNDEKLRKIGVEIINLKYETFNDKFKFKKFINKIIFEKRFNSISVYGNMNKIIRKNKVFIESEELITRYDKI